MMENVAEKGFIKSHPATSKDLPAKESSSVAKFTHKTGSSDPGLPSAPQQSNLSVMGYEHSNNQDVPSVLVSMPNVPSCNDLKPRKKDLLNDGKRFADIEMAACSDGCKSVFLQPSQVISRSRNPRKGFSLDEIYSFDQCSEHHNSIAFRDKQYKPFRTWSGKLERQASLLQGKPVLESSSDYDLGENVAHEALPADRYFDALEGPELEILKPSEDILLPKDTVWPFLLRFPISSFGISLGVSIQVILFKLLATSPSTKFLHISPIVHVVLWSISVVLVAITSFIYLLKVVTYFEAVRCEYYHPIRVNFFFAPWLALHILAIGIPTKLAKYLLHPVVWYILMVPILILELKIYGQWMLGGQRRLSKVGNPTNHIAVIGNFTGSYLGATMGLTEGALFFFAVGLAHFVVVFVTLYQRLPSNESLPKELHPVFFLFAAVPSICAAAWAQIQGSFDYGSRIAYFMALFLYASLIVRVNLCRGYKFSLTWWAYTIPMTSVAIATVSYSNQVTSIVTRSLAVLTSAASTLNVIALLVKTIIHAFVVRDLFPNDNAIAIARK